jgi:slit protein 2
MIQVAASRVITAALILLHVASAATCPLECFCQGNEITCFNTSLSSVHNKFDVSTKKLNISYNNIQTIYNGDLHNLPELKSVLLNNNGIQQVEPEVFCMTKQLEILNLSNNKLKIIEPVTFCYLKELKVLSLSNNTITFIHRSQFQNNIKLSLLDLSGNCITTFDPFTFENNKLLFQLNVKNNFITLSSNPTHQSNTALNVLDIDFTSTCNCNFSWSIMFYHSIPALEKLRRGNKSTSLLSALVKQSELLNVFRSKLHNEERVYETFLVYNSTLHVVTTSSGTPLLCYLESKSVWLWCNDARHRNIDTLYKKCGQVSNRTPDTRSPESRKFDPKFRSNDDKDKCNIVLISLFVIPTIILIARVTVLVVRLKRTKEREKVQEKVVLENMY